MITINLSTEELRVLIKQILIETLNEQAGNQFGFTNDLLSYSQVFERFYIRPKRLQELVLKGMIKEYNVNNVAKFRFSELFEAIQKMSQILEENKSKEVTYG